MSPTDSGSEGETGEKPLRERLKHTTIAKAGIDAVDEEAARPVIGGGDPDLADHIPKDREALNGNLGGRPARKRSLEDLSGADGFHEATKAEPSTPSSGGHLRKKTRELQVGEGRHTDENLQISESTRFEKEKSATEEDIPIVTAAEDNVSSVEIQTPPAEPEKEDGIHSAALLSPRKKRSREVLDQEDSHREQKIPTTEETRARRSTEEDRPTTSDLDEEEIVKPAIENGHITQSEMVEPAQVSLERAPIPKGGFGNTSAVSPFSALSKSKSSAKPTNSDATETSSSAFAASGFAVMSGSASPLTALGKPSSPISKAAAVTSPPAASKPSFGFHSDKHSTFGSGFGTGGSSTFGSANSSSGFGSVTGTAFGGGIGSGFLAGPKLSSFAALVGDTNFGTKNIDKPFGATEDSESEVSASGNDSDGPTEETATKEDESTTKFKVQDFDTGEENEDTIFVNRGKLFQFHPEQGSWKERGLGPIKLNVQRQADATSKETELLAEEEKADDGDGKEKTSPSRPQARFVMRNTATHKVILNAPIFKEMKIKDPNGKQLVFTVPMDGKLIPYTLKMSKEEDVKSLWHKVQELQGRM